MEKSCSSCMIKKRGECIGGMEPCDLYQHCPQVPSSEMESWPVIMRSNSRSNHMEWKREQKRLANGGAFPKVKRVDRKNEERREADPLKTIKRAPTEPQKKEISPEPGPQESIASLRKKYEDSIIVWINIRTTINHKFLGQYLMEYKGGIHGFKSDKHYDEADCFFDTVKQAISNVSREGYELVFISADSFDEEICGHQERFGELNKLLHSKKLTCRFRAYASLRQEIAAYVRENIHL